MANGVYLMSSIRFASKARRKEIISDIINVESKEVVFTVRTGVVINTSSAPSWEGGPSSPTTGTTQEVTIPCRVRWQKNTGGKVYKPEGQYLEGDCILLMSNTEASAGQPTLLAASGLPYVLDNTRKISVDGYELKLKTWRYGTTSNLFVYVGAVIDNSERIRV